ncbi:hypothetical protein D9M73_142400 [compost metagenome]
MTGIGNGSGHPLSRVHADLHGRGRYQTPRHTREAAADRVGPAVDITDIPDQPGVFHVITVDGQAEDGARQWSPAFIHRQQLVTMQQLAPRHTVVVEDEQLEHFNIRVLLQKGQGFLPGGKRGRGTTHGNSLFPCQTGTQKHPHFNPAIKRNR